MFLLIISFCDLSHCATVDRPIDDFFSNAEVLLNSNQPSTLAPVNTRKQRFLGPKVEEGITEVVELIVSFFNFIKEKLHEIMKNKPTIRGMLPGLDDRQVALVESSSTIILGKSCKILHKTITCLIHS